jgi:hypothetical protein
VTLNYTVLPYETLFDLSIWYVNQGDDLIEIINRLRARSFGKNKDLGLPQPMLVRRYFPCSDSEKRVNRRELENNHNMIELNDLHTSFWSVRSITFFTSVVSGL